MKYGVQKTIFIYTGWDIALSFLFITFPLLYWFKVNVSCFSCKEVTESFISSPGNRFTDANICFLSWCETNQDLWTDKIEVSFSRRGNSGETGRQVCWRMSQVLVFPQTVESPAYGRLILIWIHRIWIKLSPCGKTGYYREDSFLIALSSPNKQNNICLVFSHSCLGLAGLLLAGWGEQTFQESYFTSDSVLSDTFHNLQGQRIQPWMCPSTQTVMTLRWLLNKYISFLVWNFPQFCL